MQYKTVTSSESPIAEQLLQNKKLINIDIVKSTTTVDDVETTSYSYTQLAVETTADTDSAILQYRAEIAQEYLDSTDYYMTIDKCSTLTDERKDELTTLREEARATVRAYEDA